MLRRWMIGILVIGALLGQGFVMNSQAEVRNSRLSQLVQRKPNLYLPARLMLGEDNRFTLQGPAGNNVILYYSPQSEGFSAPDGQPLRIGEANDKLEAVIPDNGILELSLPMPDDKSLIGRDLYVEAITWKNSDYSDLKVFDLTDSTGRRTGDNKLAIAKPYASKGALVMPTIPGVSPQMMQRISTYSEVQNGNVKKKELLDNGEINKDINMDRNVFINRPGGLAPFR